MILDLSSGQTWVMVLNLVIAAFLGGLIGLEREAGHRPAGLRTTMLVCVGSALFTVLSIHAFPSAGDVSNARVAAQIVAGIGFLGAGTVWRGRITSRVSRLRPAYGSPRPSVWRLAPGLGCWRWPPR